MLQRNDLVDAKKNAEIWENLWKSHGYYHVSDGDIDQVNNEINKINAKFYEYSSIKTAQKLILYIIAKILIFIKQKNFNVIVLGSIFGAVLSTICIIPLVLLKVKLVFVLIILSIIYFLAIIILYFLFVYKDIFDLLNIIENCRGYFKNKREILPRLNSEINALINRKQKLAQIREIENSYYKYKNECDRFEKIFNSERNLLISGKHRELRGVEFEDWIEKVLLRLGFQVERTKASGDQGVDLIASNFNRRIAIQAKGYSDNVGNKAVQEVFAGAAYYSCEIKVVITNSFFTSGANDLAKKCGVILIDYNQLPEFVDGKII